MAKFIFSEPRALVYEMGGVLEALAVAVFMRACVDLEDTYFSVRNDAARFFQSPEFDALCFRLDFDPDAWRRLIAHGGPAPMENYDLRRKRIELRRLLERGDSGFADEFKIREQLLDIEARMFGRRGNCDEQEKQRDIAFAVEKAGGRAGSRCPTG